MDRRERAPHRLRGNQQCRQPRRHVFIDTEARLSRVDGGHTQAWRLGVAAFRIAPKGRRARQWADKYATPEQMWEAIDLFCRPGQRVVLWAHNIGYDLRVSRAFEILPRWGWDLDGFNLSPRATWVQWRKGTCSLLMVDSGSIWPHQLATVGKAFGLGKPDLDPWDDDDAAWLDRCQADVDILATAVPTYLDWLEREDMGNWQMTGAGQGFALFRHRFLTHKLYVHDDMDALAAERRAMWTGRCEAYWHGTLTGQVVHEWDFENAYASVASTTGVPVRLVGAVPDGYDWRRAIRHDRVAFLADVDVTTEVPVVPAAHEGRILWPIGTFQTTLWDVEILAALAAGARVTVRRGWAYHKRPALKAMADWVLDQLAQPDDVVPAWQKLFIKPIGRSWIGRFAMTYAGWELLTEMSTVDTRRQTCYDRDTGETYEMMQAGRTMWRSSGRSEWDQSMPAVTGYVMATARVRLWNIMRAIPPEALLYVDTDSILVTDRWLSTVDDVARSSIGHGLRLKRSWDGFTIHGPRAIVTGDKVRISGVSSKAAQVDRTVYRGEVWESLGTALKRGHTDHIVVRDRDWHIKGTDRRRDGHGVGWTTPIRLGGE